MNSVVFSQATGKSERTHTEYADYREAFRAWAIAISRLRRLADSGADGRLVQEAEIRAQAAELAYRDCRDRLIAGMKK